MKCEWVLDWDGGPYQTGCGELFEFTTDGPKENSFQFCPYCGRTLVDATPEGDDE